MKPSAIILFIISLHLAVQTHSQTITLSGRNIRLEKAFAEIRRQTGYVVAFDKEMIKKTSPFDVEVKNTPVSDFLNDILKNQSLSFFIKNKSIFITPAPALGQGPGKADSSHHSPPPGQPVVRISGYVYGLNHQPLAGATIRVKGEDMATTTDEKGYFELNTETGNTLIVSYVGFQQREVRLSGSENLTISLSRVESRMDTAEIVLNTGYQRIPKERATGSFVVVDEKTYNRRVGANVLDRLDGVVSGLRFTTKNTGTNYNEKLGITIRGTSTLHSLVSADPLIVVDNFIYDGDINNLNPNDIESVTVLKDAAAASIWGARSGNGVIVLTTKRGRLNQKNKIDFNANYTVAGKPDLKKSQYYLNSTDYLDIEKFLFDKGFFDDALPYNWYPISPAVDLFNKNKQGLLSDAALQEKLNQFRASDLRDEYSKYMYRKEVDQQYALSLSGGGNNISYYLSIGHDRSLPNLVRNATNRTTIQSYSTFVPVKNLEIITGINYSTSQIYNNNDLSFGNFYSDGYNRAMYPYAKFADAQGNPLAVVKNFGPGAIDSMSKLGLMDWSYRPLDELKNADNRQTLSNIALNGRIRYKITPALNVELSYQEQQQKTSGRILYNKNSFYSRDLVNKFTQIDPSDNSLSYPMPQGGILSLSQSDLSSRSLRGQTNYSNTFHEDHSIDFLTGFEIREIQTNSYSRVSFGYDDEYGTAVNYNIDHTSYFRTNPRGGFGMLPDQPADVQATKERYLSYYGNLGYNYKKRYTFTVSGRKDGSNLFGVRTNERITPLWSTGVGWNAGKESFYHSRWLSALKFRLTYGFTGNVYNGTAYLVARSEGTNIAGAPISSITKPPNPNLKWEKVRVANFGIDFEIKKGLLSGTLEFYQKNGVDLVETVPMPLSTGYFLSNLSNAARNRNRGIDLTLNARIIDRQFKWSTVLLFNYITDKVTKFDYEFPSPNAKASYLVQAGATGVSQPGKPQLGMYSYRWAGLDKNTGDPLGYLNGKPGNNYDSLINAATPDDLVFSGTLRPHVYGSLMNNFSYKGFSVSVNIVYSLGYVFRRTSTSLSYDGVLQSYHVDAGRRWKNPGDELKTNVPSFTYPSNYQRNTFYQYSSALVEDAGHIRLRDIQLAYQFRNSRIFPAAIGSLQCYAFLNNIGLLWKANKAGLDPEYYNPGIPTPLAITLGVRANFQ